MRAPAERLSLSLVVVARKIYIIKPGPLFSLVWSFVSPLLPPETRKKVQVVRSEDPLFGGEEEDELTRLTPHSLPVSMGGVVPDDKPEVRLAYQRPG